LLRSQCDTIKLSVKDEHIPIKLPFPYQINKVSVHYYTNTCIQIISFKKCFCHFQTLTTLLWKNISKS
jgi:hypothetical protein